MKYAFAAALAAFANAGKVHDFFAETNLICNLCKDVMGHAMDNNDDAIDEIYQLFPKLQERINAFQGSNELIDFSQPEATCVNMELCEGRESIEHLLLEERPLDLSAHVEFVNSNPKSSWKATLPSRFQGMSRKEIKRMMGTVVDPDWVVRAPEVMQATNATIPTDFNAANNWPDCASLITWSRDQSNCGSCWAHGTTEAFNDRWCIATGGQLQKFSVADTAGCCDGTKCLSYDCNGGQVATPWRWFKNNGVVTGGGYGDSTYCYAYTMPECAHHVESATLQPCDQITTVAP